MKWMPIETAPKDGRTILVAHQGYTWVYAVSWRKMECDLEPPHDEMCEEPTWRVDDLFAVEPTHWMPLPEPPVGGEKPVTMEDVTETYRQHKSGEALKYLEPCLEMKPKHKCKGHEIADELMFEIVTEPDGECQECKPKGE